MGRFLFNTVNLVKVDIITLFLFVNKMVLSQNYLFECSERFKRVYFLAKHLNNSLVAVYCLQLN